MLGDAEQRRLVEIETLLRAADPKFVGRFEDGWRRPRRLRLVAMIIVPIAVLMTIIGLGLGSVVVATIGLSAACAAVLVWFCHRATSTSRPRGGDHA